jgi:hypothetical protein
MNYYLQGNFKIYLSLIFHQLQFNLLYFKEISKKKKKIQLQTFLIIFFCELRNFLAKAELSSAKKYCTA